MLFLEGCLNRQLYLYLRHLDFATPRHSLSPEGTLLWIPEYPYGEVPTIAFNQLWFGARGSQGLTRKWVQHGCGSMQLRFIGIQIR